MEDIKKIVIFGTGAVAAEITSQLEDSDWGEKIGIQIKGYVTLSLIHISWVNRFGDTTNY